jgi:hypothetical protein
MKKRSSGRSRPARRRAWVGYADERLLDVRLRDLDLTIERTPVARYVHRLYTELEARGIRFRPHVWLSTEWFSPDGAPGIAIPFYLTHPRLLRLEARQMLEVEGGSEAACMRILRHEAGHALDTAYRLHTRRAWRELFGRWTDPYPEHYRPQPASRSYVVHLDAWYAQAHPAEDWAETFAVWLQPGSRWRARYRDWPSALAKLEYVAHTMLEIGRRAPTVPSRRRIEPVSELETTLREHYARKRARFGSGSAEAYDADMRRVFSDDPKYKDRPTAASFLRGLRRELRTTLAEWTGTSAYTVDQVLQGMIERSRRRRLRLAAPPREARTQAMLLLTVHTMNCLYLGRHEFHL